MDAASAPAARPGRVVRRPLHSHPTRRRTRCPRPCKYRFRTEGETLFDTEEKVFEDIQANPGEKAFVFIHTVPYEGSVALVNLLTSTRLVRKGFDVTIVLYGPGVLLASGTRGYPSVGQEAFPGHLAINNQIKTLLKEGATIHACRFAMGALYGFREDDLIPGVKAFHPLDVLDSAPHRVAGRGVPAQHLDGLTAACFVRAPTVTVTSRRPAQGVGDVADLRGPLDEFVDLGRRSSVEDHLEVDGAERRPVVASRPP